jgi:hypothetical protein
MRFLTQLSNNCRTSEGAEPNNNKRLAQTRLSNRFDIVSATTSKSQQQLAQPPMVPTRITSPTPTCNKQTTGRLTRKASLDSLIQCPVRMPSPRPKQMKRASWGGGATDEPTLPIPVRRASPVAPEQRKAVRYTPFEPTNPCILLSPHNNDNYAHHSSVVIPPRQQKRTMATIVTC